MNPYVLFVYFVSIVGFGFAVETENLKSPDLERNLRGDSNDEGNRELWENGAYVASVPVKEYVYYGKGKSKAYGYGYAYGSGNYGRYYGHGRSKSYYGGYYGYND